MATVTDGGTPMKGSVGGVTYYQRNGKTIARVKHNAPKKPVRTYKNMVQKTKWCNLLNAWKVLKHSLKGLFEDKPEGRSDYNEFLSLNLPVSRVHLTEEEVAAGACVAERLVVSHGTLANPVEVTMQGEWMLSNLSVGDLSVGPETPFYVFKAALLKHNPERLQDGDEVVFIRVSQQMEGSRMTPRIEVSSSTLTLERTDMGLLLETLSEARVREGFEVREGRLAARSVEGSLVAWVVKRTDRRGRVQVSTQRLEGYSPVLERYSSQEARDRAIVSYKGFRPYESVTPGSVDIEELRENLRINQFAKEHGLPPLHPRPTAEITTAVYPPEGGTASGAGTYERGEAITLRAEPAEGWRFHAWTDGNTLSERTVAVLAPQRYTALFLPDGV